MPHYAILHGMPTDQAPATTVPLSDEARRIKEAADIKNAQEIGAAHLAIKALRDETPLSEESLALIQGYSKHTNASVRCIIGRALRAAAPEGSLERLQHLTVVLNSESDLGRNVFAQTFGYEYEQLQRSGISVGTEVLLMAEQFKTSPSLITRANYYTGRRDACPADTAKYNSYNALVQHYSGRATLASAQLGAIADPSIERIKLKISAITGLGCDSATCPEPV